RVFRRKFYEVPCTREPDLVAFVGREISYGVDRFVVVLRAPAPDGVVILEAETERIDSGVAAHAIVVLRQLCDLFAHRQVRVELRILERDGHGWRLERHAHDGPGEKYAAMNGRGCLARGKGRE